ncbi:MAG: PAS domain S-box protein [Anaerolineae bacterium]|nr:PAS domain S-box protein [Anaerolineae bacterium]
MAAIEKPDNTGQMVSQSPDGRALLEQHVTIFRPLLELSPDPSIIYDPIGQVVYVNPAFTVTFGWENEELLGSRLNFVPEERREETTVALAALFTDGRATNFITKRLTKDGRVLDVQISAILLSQEGGPVFGSLVIIRDITAQKEAERTLRASETRYREMLESTPDAYYEVDLSGAITYYSSGLADVLGYPEDELLGLSNRDYADAENARQIYEAFRQVFQTGQPAKAILMHTIRKDGTPQILETSIALRHDTAGKVIGFRGIARDVTSLITEREAAQAASARSEARYRDILESIKDGYYEVDLDGSIIMINKQAVDIFGYPREQLLGMNFRQYTSPETAEISYKAFNHVFRTGEPIEGLTHAIITADGEERYIEVSISLVKDANEDPTGFRGIVRNVTGRIRDEETLRQSEERYRTILDSIEDGYYEADLDGNFTFMNDQLCQVIGYPREELMGKNYREYTTPETAERVFNTFNHVYKTGEPVKGFVWEAIGMDGRTRHLETFVLPRHDKEGRAVGFRGVGRDITQRVQAEEALAEALIDQERIANQLATVAKVSTAVSTILEPQEMLQAVVDQVKESFDLYHAHAYLLNEAGDTLELVAGAGKVGQQMVQEGRPIPLAAEQSLVARAARSRTGVIVHNVRKDPHFLPHPLLPETRSEMAVPMIVGGQVLGVLDLQADTTNRFTQRYVNIQTTLAAQIAVALQNARLFAQAQQQTAELQETTALLDQIIEILPVGLFMKEAQNLRFVRWNKANEAITGLKYQDVIGKNDYDLFTKDQADFFTEKDRQVLKGNTIVEIPEETIATPHLGQRLLHTRKLPILGVDGAPRYLLGVSEDITERNQSEKELREINERIQTVLESLSTPVIIVAVEGAKVMYANELLAETVGIPLTELPGMVMHDFYVHVEDSLSGLERMQAEGSIVKYEAELKRKSGEHFWALVSTRLFNYQGEPAYIATLVDISDRKRVEAQLRLQDTALNSAANGIAITDDNGTILWVNQAFSRLTQYDVQEAIGENPRILKSEQQDKRFYQGMWETIKGGQVWHGEIVNRRKDGSLYTEEMTITPVRAEGEEISHYIAIKQDITERKEAQEALAKSEQVVHDSLRMQQILHEVNLELSQVESLDELFKQAVHLGKMRLNLERFALYMYDEARDCFTGTYGVDRDGNPRDERGPEFDIVVPDAVQFFRDIKQRLMIREDCELWDHGVVVGRGWNITAPLREGNKLAGLLFTDNLLSQQPLLPHLPDLIIAYSNIIVNLIERKRAEESVATALAETERLYEMSARLNAAASVNEILEAVVVPVAGRGIMSATLFTLEVDANGRPEWMELVAVWNRPGSILASMDFPIGSRLYLPDLPTSTQWIDAPDELLLYDDVERDTTLDEATRGLFQMSGVKASATLPLHAGNKWVGVINLSWNEIKSFTEDDRRTFHTLTDQAAIIMNNQLLFEQTQKRVTELATVAEVGAAITTIREVDVLLQRVVDLTKERFDLYHAHIYLLDEAGRNLVLTSGAGEVGRQMVAEGRIIPLDQAQSLIARAARKRQGIIVNDVTADADFLPHRLLPETRSEMAVPMIVADEVLGVLDIQASRTNHFSEGDVQIQTTLAAQIGVALQNARSFARSETALNELQEVTRRLRREGWESYAQASGRNGLRYAYDQKEVKALMPATAVTPATGKQKTPTAPTTPTLTHPLQVQGESIGRLMLAEPSVVDEDARDIVTAVAERLSAHIENLRLSEQTEQARQQAERLFRGSAALNTAQSYDDVLNALRANSIMGHASVNNVSLNFFDHPWEGQRKPAWVDVLTRWTRLPEEAVSQRYALANFPSADNLLHPDAPVVIEDVAKDPRLDENLRTLYKERFQAKSTIFVPLVIGSQWVGYINAIYAEKLPFSDDEIRRLTTLGQQAAVTIQSIRLFAQAEARAHELAILNEMVSELTTMLAVEPILEAIYRFSSRLMDTTNFYIALHNQLTNEIAFPIAVEENKQVRWPSRPYGNGMTEYLLRTGQPLFVEDGLEKWLRGQGVDSIGTPSQSWMGVPLRLGSEVVGVIALQSLQPRFYTREQFDLLNAMANQAAIAIQNARQFQQEQARAQRQQMLREIAAKVRSSADVDTIMRTAVQEIGQALGRQTFVYLDTTTQTKVQEDAYHEPDK